MSQEFKATKSAHGRSLAAQLDHLRGELEGTQAEQQRLQKTLRDIARETDLSIGGVCCHCEEAYVVIKDGVLSCPSCSNRAAV